MRSHSRPAFVTAVSAALAIAAAWSAPAAAGPTLAGQKNCLSCHQIDAKIVGPSYKDVAAKYAGQADAPARLAQKVMKGGSGVWGAVPMPANPQVSEAEAKQLLERLQRFNPDDPQLRLFLGQSTYAGQHCDVSARRK